MKTYKVHIFAIVRVPVEVEALTPEDAIKAANTEVDLDERIRNGVRIEYADAIDGYVVDELHPINHNLVETFHFDQEGNRQ